MGTRRIFVVLAILAHVGLVLGADGALAQKPAAVAPRTHAPVRAAGARKPAAADASATPPSASGSLAPAAPVALAGAGASTDAGVIEAKAADGGPRVFKFNELDIEGRLKSPQLVYFLRRVRAEFAAGDLGHRSFMREMSETRRESSF